MDRHPDRVAYVAHDECHRENGPDWSQNLGDVYWTLGGCVVFKCSNLWYRAIENKQNK